MLMQYDLVSELLLTHRAAVGSNTDGRLHAVDTVVRFQITLGGEGSRADPASERSFAGVYAIMHLEGTFAAQHTMAYHTLVGICDLLLDILHQLLELGGLRGSESLLR